MDRTQASHDKTPENAYGPAMGPNFQQPYRKSDEEIIGMDSASLTHLPNNIVTFNLDIDQKNGGFRSVIRRKRWIVFTVLCTLTVIIIFLVLLIVLRPGRSTRATDEDITDKELSSRLGAPGSGTEGLSCYPFNFLQTVTPKPIHSHNDYLRKVPLCTALRHGCVSVEADVWLFDDPEHLYVGHDQASLRPNRTFQALYIQPLVNILTRQNPVSGSYNATSRGVFDTAPNQTLTLLVDVKTAGPETWAKVVEQLEPLRERGWLTHVANGTIHPGPITVVGSGNTPFDLLTQNTTYRDYFFDAPLDKLQDDTFNGTNSYYASVGFRSAIGRTWMGTLSTSQVGKVRRQVEEAHAKGLKVRYWDLPQWPIGARHLIWDYLKKEGADVLNADDVGDAARLDWH
ncbi:Altered inheritance of mitochondria protein 6 [Cytospora mali]|uniref:Altered inheritance of mitochondria protein 6 n=1 Tax=Cytospora mali TaxID=578113 RepID=A0A194VIU4_CYTMA|nr:Altered inheritance of mitochondria protein 6 [Valsa mali]